MTASNVLTIEGLSKSFSGNKVLNSFSLEINRGEFHALVGENGAGKSTLINLITGVYEPDAGSLSIDGKDYRKMTPSLSKTLGIRAVHQELSLNLHLSVMENLFLGDELLKRGVFLDKKLMAAEARALLDATGLSHVDADDELESLPLSDRQLLEFAKAVYKRPKLLILDEATSALNNESVSLMFARLKELKAEGLAILFISHRLNEVYSLCDVMTVLKDGEKVTTEPVGDFDQNRMVSLMTGRNIGDFFPDKRVSDERPVLMRLDGVSTARCRDISCSINKREILGIGGLAGQGQNELMECLFGVERKLAGHIYIDGHEVSVDKPSEAMRRGIAYLPAERKTQGLFTGHSNKFNMSFARLKEICGKFGGIDSRAEERDNLSQVKNLEIKIRSMSQLVGELSGGNQQKIALAKWLLRNPRVLLLNDPTRGIDVGTKKQIYELLRGLAENDVAVVMISSDTLELVGVCDRVIVMYEHRINCELAHDELSEESLVHASVFRKGSAA